MHHEKKNSNNLTQLNPMLATREAPDVIQW